MNKAQEKKLKKIASNFQKKMQALIDDNESGITGISINFEGEKPITIAGEPTNETSRIQNKVKRITDLQND